METSCFPKTFYLKKDEFCIQRMNKKISKEAKRQEKVKKQSEKNHIDNNKEKTGILCETGAFCTVWGIF